MSADPRLRVVLCWHMHQPQYRDLLTDEYLQPWTYLHAIKDYVDMAALMDEVPAARTVVNFSPVLLEQLADYNHQVQGFLNEGRPIGDPLLAALCRPDFADDQPLRETLIAACLRANEKHLINRYPAYRRLADMAIWFQDRPSLIRYLDDQYLADIVVWYHLAWLGETVHRRDVRVKRLIDKEEGFTPADRQELLAVIAELLDGVIDHYRRLAQRGQVELAMNPYGHPIVPLLIDFTTAREAMPEVALPEASGYPDGRARARWHLQRGIEVFERFFGQQPKGCWPSEGSLSTETVAMLGEFGFAWAASGEGVLRNSLKLHQREHEIAEVNALHRPYRVADSSVECFFRDDGLSDLIGFAYADWHGDDAAADFVRHLENLADACATNGNDCVVSVILDGENAWEYYPNNGYHFLVALYRLLSNHPRLQMVTFSDVVADDGVSSGNLPEVVAGSWVYGTFSTWIGERDKNLAWDYLVHAKMAYDRAVASGELSGERLEEATRQLAICEASDWFWWFGDYNPEDAVSDFERLYRRHLHNLYQLIGVPPPGYLEQVMAHGHGHPELGGVMRHGAPVT